MAESSKADMTDKLKSIIGSLKTANSYLVLGPVDLLFEEIKKEIEKEINKLDFSFIGTNDQKGVVTIASVRDLISEISNTPNGSFRFALIKNADRLNSASSNALLKTLEEPPRRVKIVLLSDTDQLLETIKSRCRLIDLRNEVKIDFSNKEKEVDQLLSGGIAHAFNIIDEVVKEGGEVDFLVNLERYFYKKMLEKKDAGLADKLGKILKIREDIRRNVNKKLALENLIIYLVKK